MRVRGADAHSTYLKTTTKKAPLRLDKKVKTELQQYADEYKHPGAANERHGRHVWFSRSVLFAHASTVSPGDQTETNCPVWIFLFAFPLTLLLLPVVNQPAASVPTLTQMHRERKKTKTTTKKTTCPQACVCVCVCEESGTHRAPMLALVTICAQLLLFLIKWHESWCLCRTFAVMKTGCYISCVWNHSSRVIVVNADETFLTITGHKCQHWCARQSSLVKASVAVLERPESSWTSLQHSPSAPNSLSLEILRLGNLPDGDPAGTTAGKGALGSRLEDLVLPWT